MFIPSGYMYKTIVKDEPWMGEHGIKEICSFGGCVSEDFMDDYILKWRHNDFWLFDKPEIMNQLAHEASINLSDMNLLYYEVWDEQYVEQSKTWQTFKCEFGFGSNVSIPQSKELLGFDVCCFSGQTSPECSPLSCNELAKEMNVNSHCLFNSFEDAYKALEQGKFDNSEPGPFRIAAVYRVDL